MSHGVTFDFSGKRCLVTGAGKGIGRGCVEALVRAGATVFALSRTLEDLDSLMEELRQEGKDHLLTTECVDLRNWDATREAVQKCLPIQMLVNNAGVFGSCPFYDATPSLIADIFEVNVKAMFNVTQVVSNRMIEEKITGSIVNLSSVGSLSGFSMVTTYSASKGAMDAAMRSLAAELGPKGIRINSVNPTIVYTRMSEKLLAIPEFKKKAEAVVPLGKLARVDDVVGPVLFLLSDAAQMINGASIPIDGGISNTTLVSGSSEKLVPN